MTSEDRIGWLIVIAAALIGLLVGFAFGTTP